MLCRTSVCADLLATRLEFQTTTITAKYKFRIRNANAVLRPSPQGAISRTSGTWQAAYLKNLEAFTTKPELLHPDQWPSGGVPVLTEVEKAAQILPCKATASDTSLECESNESRSAG